MAGSILTEMPRSRAYRVFARYVAFAERHTLLILGVLALVCAGALHMSLKL